MKKLSLYVFLVLIFSSLVFADSSKVIPSIEKLFKEKVKYIAEGDLFYGCIYFIGYVDEDLFTQKTSYYLMPPERSVDIDTKYDWKLVNFLINNTDYDAKYLYN